MHPINSICANNNKLQLLYQKKAVFLCLLWNDLLKNCESYILIDGYTKSFSKKSGQRSSKLPVSVNVTMKNSIGLKTLGRKFVIGYGYVFRF